MEITPKSLSREIQRSREQEQMTERLGLLAMALARRYMHGRQWQGYSVSTREDIVSAFLVRLVRGWQRVDPAGNPFSYLTAMVRSAAVDHIRHENRRTARETKSAGA